MSRTNKFLRTDDLIIRNVSKEKLEAFKRFQEEMHKKNTKEQETTDNVHIEQVPDYILERNKKKITNQVLETTEIVVDSSDRDLVLYPNQNSFVVNLDKIYNNVQEIEMISSEFPRSQFPIRSGVNNKIYWTNQEELDLDYPVYSIEITPGSYTLANLSSEIQTRMNSVKRRNGTGDFHFFLVNIDESTNKMEIKSFIQTQLENDPITTTSGSNVVSINFKDHGFLETQEFLLKSVDSIGGIDSSLLDGTFTATVVDNSNITFEVSVEAQTTVTAGGNTVKVGKRSPFKFQWGDYTDSGASFLGFKTQNSSQDLVFSGTSPLYTTIHVLDSAAIVDSTSFTITTTTNHGVSLAQDQTITNFTTLGNVTVSSRHSARVGDYVFFENTDEASGGLQLITAIVDLFTFTVDNGPTVGLSSGTVKVGGELISINGLNTTPALSSFNPDLVFLAETPLSSPLDTIKISLPIIFISDIPVGQVYIGTSSVNVRHTAHSFNRITSIVDGNTELGFNTAVVTTQLPHGITAFVSSLATFSDDSVDTVEITSFQFSGVTDDVLRINVFGATEPSFNGEYFAYVQEAKFNTFFVNFPNGGSFGGSCNISSVENVYINHTNCDPVLNGHFTMLDEIDATSFRVYNFPAAITQSGTTGIIGNTDIVELDGATGETATSRAIGNIPISSINNNSLRIVSIVDANEYRVRVPNQYSSFDPDLGLERNGGGNNMTISSFVDGYNYLQDNFYSGSLHKTIKLDGPDYVFMILENLKTNLITLSGIEDLFQKIRLEEPVGKTSFNTMTGKKLVFDRITRLAELSIKIKNPDGTLYDFNGQDFSFTLRIVEKTFIPDKTLLQGLENKENKEKFEKIINRNE